MDSASHAALPLANPDDITERENITYNMSNEHMREKKHVLGYNIF